MESNEVSRSDCGMCSCEYWLRSFLVVVLIASTFSAVYVFVAHLVVFISTHT